VPGGPYMPTFVTARCREEKAVFAELLSFDIGKVDTCLFFFVRKLGHGRGRERCL